MAVQLDDKNALRAEVGKRLEKAIQSAGYRRAGHFADDVSIDRRKFYQYLNGSKMPPHHIVKMVADKCGFDAAYLYCLSNRQHETQTAKAQPVDLYGQIGIAPENKKVIALKGDHYIVDLSDNSARVAGCHILEIDGEIVIESVKRDLSDNLYSWDIDADDPKSDIVCSASIVGRVVAKITHY